MDLNLLKNGIERDTFTEYINQLNRDIHALYLDILNNDQFTGKIDMITKRMINMKCHEHLQMNIIFEKEPKLAEIALEKKHFNLTTIKLSNMEAIELIKKLINDELYIIEYPRILTMLLPSLFVKILPKDTYNKVKNKYLKHKTIKIYTGSKIIQ
ncbi:hypothetical protein KHQ88_00835 [Mycoplasmatota bacterium]|nr:hypothetical protein KHQ88_00835 [Mycoplasmatota bacterium]